MRTGAAPAVAPRAALLRHSQIERIVDDLQRPRPVLFVDDATNLYLAGGDVLNIDLRVGQGLEHAAGDAGVDAHADADDAHFRQIIPVGDASPGGRLHAEVDQ